MVLFTLSSSMEIREDGETCYTMYHMVIAVDSETMDSQLLFSLTMWLYSVLLKLVPCLVLTIFTASLIRAMYKAVEKSGKLKGGEEGKTARIRTTDNTSRLLIVILVLFLIAEFPQVIWEI